MSHPSVATVTAGAEERRRAGGARARLLAAALATFREVGYFAASVEEIAAAAGVSRMTFYRQFADKAEIAAELFRVISEDAKPRMIVIRERDWRDRAAVAAWIADLFEADRASGNLLRIFIQASADEDGFTASAHTLIADLIAELGRDIPAFAVDPTSPAQRRRWLEAWLLTYELLDQSNHAARHSGIADDPLVIDLLADRFLRFVAMS